MRQKLREFIAFLIETIRNRNMIVSLANNDFKARFAGSYFGIFWAFATPVVTIMVFWFVFEIGFKSAPVQDVPFILWFMPAYLAWAFFSDALASTTNTLYEYSYLVKKVKFRVSMLPMVKLLSTFYVHLFFIAFIILSYVFSGEGFQVQYFQIIYYTASLGVLLTGFAWLLSSLAPFFRDLSQLIGVVLQIGFWMTPIFWDPTGMSPGVLTVLKLNPMYYITSGYRDCFISGTWFWERPLLTLYFWGVTSVVFILGAYVFQKLRPHFADVL